jgi:hypothetical protein
MTSTSPTPLASCGTVPTSTGPAATAATISLHSPSTAPRGSTITVTTTLRALSNRYRIITDPRTSEVLVLADNRVVGRTGHTGRSLLTVPVPLRQAELRPLQVVPDAVRLVGCPAAGRDTGADLPAGRYAMVAVLGYTMDSLNSADSGIDRTSGARPFTLVSAPVPLTIQ